MAAVPENQVDDLVAIREQHERIGYESELVTGPRACREYLTWAGPTGAAGGVALHERRGAAGRTMQTVRRLAELARAGSRDSRRGGGGGLRARRKRPSGRSSPTTVNASVRDAGAGPRPWRARLGRCWDSIRTSRWTARRAAGGYLKLRKGEFALGGARASPGARAARRRWCHLDQAGPLLSDRDASVLVDGPWGIYFGWGERHGITGGGCRCAFDPGWTLTARTTQNTASAGLSRFLHLRVGRGTAALPRSGRRLEADSGGRHRGPHPGQLSDLRLGAR